jgi:hypothetical protein
MTDELKPDDDMPRSPHHVLDELKNVLSGLGQRTEPAAPVEPKQELMRDLPTQPAFFPTETPLPATPKNADAPTPVPSRPASDADFWSGNVLGWPADLESPQKESLGEPMSPPPLMPAFSEPADIVNTSPPLPPAVSSPVEAPVSDQQILPPAPAVDRAPWPDSDILPEPPASPRSPEKLETAPNPFAFSATEIESLQKPPAQPPVEAEPPFPLPRTVEEPEPHPAIQDGNPLLHVDAAAKPKDLVQLACFFPEGSEKMGQQFAKQLRDAGAQHVPPLVIEPVLVSSWSAGSVDMGAWTKSARLSGADIMFILSPRQEIKNFQNNPSIVATRDITMRIIATEHVPLRTLYTDIMIQLKRPA